MSELNKIKLKLKLKIKLKLKLKLKKKKKSKSIVLLDQKLIEVHKFKSTTLALK
jgi:hypothetical protein